MVVNLAGVQQDFIPMMIKLVHLPSAEVIVPGPRNDAARSGYLFRCHRLKGKVIKVSLGFYVGLGLTDESLDGLRIEMFHTVCAGAGIVQHG